MNKNDLIELARRYFIADVGLSMPNLIGKIQVAQGSTQCFAHLGKAQRRSLRMSTEKHINTAPSSIGQMTHLTSDLRVPETGELHDLSAATA